MRTQTALVIDAQAPVVSSETAALQRSGLTCAILSRARRIGFGQAQRGEPAAGYPILMLPAAEKHAHGRWQRSKVLPGTGAHPCIEGHTANGRLRVVQRVEKCLGGS